MRLHFSLVFMLSGYYIVAQTFTAIPEISSFEGVFNSSTVFADVNGDGDLDVFITGQTQVGDPISKLYTNDGTGTFAEKPGTPFEGVRNSAVAVSDIDGDNDLDVLITGESNQGPNGSYIPISKLYTNDGTGNFTEKVGTPFEDVRFGSVAFADVDGDNDSDVLITGAGFLGPIAKLYTNDGTGTFTEQAGTPFNGVSNSSIAFADIDGDSDQDVLITGLNGSVSSTSKLYTNNGTGAFVEQTGTPFEHVARGAIAFTDVDGDNDPDVLITGEIGFLTYISKLYTNDGTGNFTEKPGTPFDGVSNSAITLGDVNGDNHPDVLITGQRNLAPAMSKLYTNDGTGIFTEKTGTPFERVTRGTIALADIDGDSDQDVLITGTNNTGGRVSRLYANDGAGNFTTKAGPRFEGVYYSAIAFSDVDGDSDPDVLITGATSGDLISILYLNDGTGAFSPKSGTPFENVFYSSVAFADVDGDNTEDVFITGITTLADRVSKLYTNDGSGNFTEKTGTPFEGVGVGSIAFADVDGDLDQDVLITGNSSSDYIARLYTNDGAGNFTEKPNTPFSSAGYSSIAFADIDGDNDADVLITGVMSSGFRSAKLYSNDGTGTFTEKMGTPFEGVANSSISFADVDGDNDPDLLITGYTDVNTSISRLYTNDGTGNFTEKVGLPFGGVSNSSIAFADVDGDLDQDVFITGTNNSSYATSRLYTNDGAGNFAEDTETVFEGVSNGSIAFADVDGDSDPDVLLTGVGPGAISKLYLNNTTVSIDGEMPLGLEGDFVVYPNPAAGYVTIRYVHERQAEVEFSIFDLSGRQLHYETRLLPGGEQTLFVDISSFRPGHYIVYLKDGYMSRACMLMVN